MAVKNHAEYGDESEHNKTLRSLLMGSIVLFCWVHSLVRPAPRAFFRPDRQISQPPRAGPVKAGRVFRGHPQGLALTGPSTAARSIGSGLEAAGICVGLGVHVTHCADELSCRFFLCV